MTAGTAQFDADRTLGFFNRPFAAMTEIEPEWLSERPEFDRVIERMRENQRLPEVRDFPAWREERRGWFTSAEEAIEEEWLLPNGDHIRLVAQPLPDGGLRLFLEDRTEQLRMASARDTLAAGALGDLQQSVRGDQRLRQRRPALPVESPLPRGLGGRGGMACDPSAGRRPGARLRAQTGQPARPRRKSAKWSARR